MSFASTEELTKSVTARKAASAKAISDFAKDVKAEIKGDNEDAITKTIDEYIGREQSKYAILKHMQRFNNEEYHLQKDAYAENDVRRAAVWHQEAMAFWQKGRGLPKKKAEAMAEKEQSMIEKILEVRFKSLFRTGEFEDGKKIDLITE